MQGRLLVVPAMVFAVVLAACGQAPAPAPTAVPQARAEAPAPTAAPAAAVPTAAVPAPSPTALAPTPVPALTPTVSAGARVITQEITMRSQSAWGTSSGPVEAEVGMQGNFTMTAKITVGNVDGIDHTSVSVPMPGGAVQYDPTRPPKIGDVVQHPSGLIVQVVGVKTADVDAENQFVLVDVIVGNAGKERQLVATDPSMAIVSGDGHWYSAHWYSLYWLAQGAETFTAKNQEMRQNMLRHNITSNYSAALEPGQAAKGTAVFPVPKSAKQLAFGFQPYSAAAYLMFANEGSPTVFVPLGLGGDFPVIPGDVATLEAGKTYAVGQAFKAPKRGIAIEVISAWLRLESLGDTKKLRDDEQFVIVSLTAPADGGAKPLDPKRELALVDGSGRAFELQAYASDWLTFPLGPYNQRGVAVFKGPRAATGLKLTFNPLDPATMAGSAPTPLQDEAVTIDLGQLAAPSSAATPAATAARPTPIAAATPLAGAEPVPDELKDVPIPSGFNLVKGSVERETQGSIYRVQAAWLGQSDAEQIFDFYQAALAQGWQSHGGVINVVLDASYTKRNTDPPVKLYVRAEPGNVGTTLRLTITNGEP